jgi:hypothetical protein
MTPASTFPLAAAVLPTNLSSFSRCPPRRLPRVSCLAAPERRGGGNASNASRAPQQQPGWRAAVSAVLAAAVVAASMPAYADLNKFEAEQRGEFGIGSAAQFGSADLKYASTSASFASLLHDRFVVTIALLICFLCVWSYRKAVHVNENFRWVLNFTCSELENPNYSMSPL